MAASQPQLLQLLAAALPLLSAAKAAGQAVLVHCNAGMHRSCSMLCALLMAEQEGCTLEQAFSQVLQARSICFPSFHAYLGSAGFQQALAQLTGRKAGRAAALALACASGEPGREGQ
jgi:protein-tyrosine phosphatase